MLASYGRLLAALAVGVLITVLISSLVRLAGLRCGKPGQTAVTAEKFKLNFKVLWLPPLLAAGITTLMQA